VAFEKCSLDVLPQLHPSPIPTYLSRNYSNEIPDAALLNSLGEPSKVFPDPTLLWEERAFLWPY
jgi:hypothetical protein